MVQLQSSREIKFAKKADCFAGQLTFVEENSLNGRHTATMWVSGTKFYIVLNICICWAECPSIISMFETYFESANTLMF